MNQGRASVGWARGATGVVIFLGMAVAWTMAVQALADAPDAAALKAIAGKVAVPGQSRHPPVIKR